MLTASDFEEPGLPTTKMGMLFNTLTRRTKIFSRKASFAATPLPRTMFAENSCEVVEQNMETTGEKRSKVSLMVHFVSTPCYHSIGLFILVSLPVVLTVTCDERLLRALKHINTLPAYS